MDINIKRMNSLWSKNFIICINQNTKFIFKKKRLFILRNLNHEHLTMLVFLFHFNLFAIQFHALF